MRTSEEGSERLVGPHWAREAPRHDEVGDSGLPAASGRGDSSGSVRGCRLLRCSQNDRNRPVLNTDQGVHHHSEYVSGKLICGMKVKVAPLGGHHAWNRFSTRDLRTRMGGFQLRCIPPYLAVLLGPERCVSYVWAGSSRRKRRGRAEAVLTCKSFVRPGYRGERLIEASGSWFTPKFLLG